jgi:N-acetylmuramoyl-L-alanine amidase
VLFFRVLIIACILTSTILASRDFQDFDMYQGKFSAEEAEQKIHTFLAKDPEIRNYYRLTPEALYLGDLEHEQLDYVLHFNTALSPSSDKPPRKQGLHNVKIAIDPGHFGGAYAELEERYIHIPAEETKNNQAIRFNEGDLPYLTALELQRLLESEGATVIVTREAIGRGTVQDDFIQWLENANFPPDMSLSKIFRNYYNREDLIARAKKINEFSPDVTIVIHYNSHSTNNDSHLTESNYSLAFIPGAFGKGELNTVEARYELMRLLLTNDLEESLKLSEYITAQFVKQLGIPLIVETEKTSYTDKVCLLQKPGIYSRNLALTRLVHGPVCYGETLIQNNQDEVYRLAERTTSISGVPCSGRIKEVARAYFEGIKEYFDN